MTNGTGDGPRLDGPGPLDDLAVGDWVAVHWDWICDRLTADQRNALHRYTTHHLTIVNDRAKASAVGAAGAKD